MDGAVRRSWSSQALCLALLALKMEGGGRMTGCVDHPWTPGREEKQLLLQNFREGMWPRQSLGLGQ